MRHNASNSCKLKLPYTNTQEGEEIIPQTDYISKLLHIGSINILDLNYDEKTIVVAFKLQRRPHICPGCAAITDKVHDYREIFENLRQFPNRKEVQYFITDMCKPYILNAIHLFPKATIVINRFHVVRYCTWALENVRKREQKKLLPEQPNTSNAAVNSC